MARDNNLYNILQLNRKYYTSYLTALALLGVLLFCAFASGFLMHRTNSLLPILGTDASSIKQYDATVQATGRSLKWNLIYMNDNHSLNQLLLDGLVSSPRGVNTLIITLQIQSNLAEIIEGQRDNNLKKIALQLRDWQSVHPHITVIVRPFHEMNGDWYPWGFKNNHNSNSVSQFDSAWWHVRRVMRSEFSTLEFMWCPNILMGNRDNFSLYYPGNSQVEYLGLDGYNQSSSNQRWTTIEQIFHSSLIAIRSTPSIESNKPLIIAETATTEPANNEAGKGHSKAEWFSNTNGNMGWWLHNEAPKFRVYAVLYFDYNKTEKGTQNDYLIYDPLLSNAAKSREAFRKSVYDLP